MKKFLGTMFSIVLLGLLFWINPMVTYAVEPIAISTIRENDVFEVGDVIYNDTDQTVVMSYSYGGNDTVLALASERGSFTKIFSGTSHTISYYHKVIVRNDFYVEPVPPTTDPVTELPSSTIHTHDFVTGTIYKATCEHDGLEGTYCKTCGFIKESSPISAYEYTLETYAGQKITAAKSGQKIVLEFKELNSFPKAFMEKIAARVAEGVSFEFRYNVNHELQKITIPAYSTVDTSLDWYGYAKMAELYGAN